MGAAQSRTRKYCTFVQQVNLGLIPWEQDYQDVKSGTSVAVVAVLTCLHALTTDL